VRRKYTWDHNAARVSKVAEALVAERGAAR
jgi:hypothetical protein